MRHRIGAALLALGLLPGCATVFQDTSCVKIRERSRPSDPLVRKSPKDRYLGIVGGSPSDPGFGFARFPLRLWAPFRYELRAGLFTARAIQLGDGIVLCTELDELASAPLRFIAFCGQRTQGGFNLFVSTNLGGAVVNLPGTLFLAGADEVELAVEATATQLEFSARPAGAATWQPVEQYPYASQPAALLASVGASNLTQRKSEVAFDDVRLVANAPMPGAPTPADIVAEAMLDAFVALYDAAGALDGGSPSFTDAAAALAGAQGAIDAATAALAGLPPDRATTKAAKQLRGATKKVAAAQAKVAREKAPPAVKRIRAAAKKVDKALAPLLPYPIDF